VQDLARELLAAFETGGAVAEPPSAREASFDIAAAYAVEAEVARLRVAAGHTLAGRKVGYANKAMWRVLKLESLVRAHMYDDTVRFAAENGTLEFSLANCLSPKIEPEVVFKLRRPVGAGLDAAAALDAVEWMAIGFEIIDCPFPGWQFQPADFVAALGLHKGLVIGPPSPIGERPIPDLVNQLAGFKLRILKNGEKVDEGSGRNSLRSPALCLAELGNTTSLAAGEIISTGTLTTAQPLTPGETWSVEVEGLPVSNLVLRTQ
jgi:2-keto-4-pentenoate hydratase